MSKGRLDVREDFRDVIGVRNPVVIVVTFIAQLGQL